MPGNAKVRNVDKFQEQEASIVLIPMVTSSVEDLLRNIEVLYSKKTACMLLSLGTMIGCGGRQSQTVGNPMCTVERMKWVNTFCCLSAYAQASA